MPRLLSALVVLVPVFAYACSSATTQSGSATAPDGGAVSNGNGPGPQDGTPVSESPHTPATGCKPGFQACGNVCADLTSDSRHCGACGNACGYGDGAVNASGCVASACVEGGGCPYGISCGGTCFTPSSSIDNCGSCGNRCSDRQVCYRSACVNAQGDGASCASPLVLPEDDGSYELRYPTGMTGTHVFPCGPLQAVPTRWFRWTARKDDSTTEFGIKNAPATDNYVIEVFSSATCDASVSLGCSDDKKPGTDLRPEATVATTAGKTYFIAVGRIQATSGVTPALHIDD